MPRRFAMAYYGQLTWAPLYVNLFRGETTTEKADRTEAVVRRDLLRDAAFTRVEPLGQGRFDVAYERIGRIEGTSLVTFVRRNEDILTIRADSEGRTTIRARSILPEQAEPLIQAGLGMRGLLRVVTDARVVEHNADDVRPFQEAWRIYEWRVDGFDAPAPQIVLQLDRPQLDR